MRIAVINEVSSRDKNQFILDALKDTVKAGVFNVGMSQAEGCELTYIQTGLMAATALNTGAADFVVGGCGTGQGFLISVMQYPNVYCGHITNPLDAWLFSQINGGNCVSLALNKNFGWAGDINLRYIFEKLFCDPAGRGYPPHRAESQAQSRKLLADINKAAHKGFADVLKGLDKNILKPVAAQKPFMEFLQKYSEGDKYAEIKDILG